MLNPIFFIGAPRSGTTVIFEEFCAHVDIAWISNYSRIFPSLLATNIARRLFENSCWSIRGRKNQFNDSGALRRFLPRPDESYEFWTEFTCPDFATSFLTKARPSDAVRTRLCNAFDRIAFYQGFDRLAAKLTGPPRISYLSSIFPRAIFVHVVRDGVNVVQSLLNVDFWREKGGLKRPWWADGLSADDISEWEHSQRDPAILAAIQWRKIIEVTHQESAILPQSQYTEIRYEDFCANSELEIAKLLSFCGLSRSRKPIQIQAIRKNSYADRWELNRHNRIVTSLGTVYRQLGYGDETPT